MIDFYWIMGEDEGRTILLGPYATLEEANSKAWEKLNCYFQVVPLPTRDRGRATQMIKARKLDQTADLSESLRRVRHRV